MPQPYLPALSSHLFERHKTKNLYECNYQREDGVFLMFKMLYRLLATKNPKMGLFKVLINSWLSNYFYMVLFPILYVTYNCDRLYPFFEVSFESKDAVYRLEMNQIFYNFVKQQDNDSQYEYIYYSLVNHLKSYC